MRARTIFRSVTFSAALVAGLLVAGSSWAQAPPAEQTVVGSVVGIATLNNNTQKQVRISVLTDSGQFETVEVCPTVSMNPSGLPFSMGDRILAMGEMTQENGVPILESCNVQLVASGQPPAYAPPSAGYAPDYGTAPDYGYYPDYGYNPDYGWSPWWYSSPFFVEPFFGLGFFGRHRGFDGDFDRDDFRHGSGHWNGTGWNHSGSGMTTPSPALSGASGTTGTRHWSMGSSGVVSGTASPSVHSSAVHGTGSSGWHVSTPAFHSSGVTHSSAPAWHSSGATHFSAPATHFSAPAWHGGGSVSHSSAPAFHGGGGGGVAHFSGGGGHFSGGHR